MLPETGSLTNELNGLVQPGKELLTVIVVDRNAHEVTVTDEIWLGTRVAGIEDVAYPILGHQILAKTERSSLVQHGIFPVILRGGGGGADEATGSSFLFSIGYVAPRLQFKTLLAQRLPVWDCGLRSRKAWRILCLLPPGKKQSFCEKAT